MPTKECFDCAGRTDLRRGNMIGCTTPHPDVAGEKKEKHGASWKTVVSLEGYPDNYYFLSKTVPCPNYKKRKY